MIALIALFSILSAVLAKPAAQTYSYTTSVQSHSLPATPLIPAVPAARLNLGYTYYEPAALVAATPLLYTYPNAVALGRSVANSDKTDAKIIIADPPIQDIRIPEPILNDAKATPEVLSKLDLAGRNSVQEELPLEPLPQKLSELKSVVIQEPQMEQVQNDEIAPTKPKTDTENGRQKRHIAVYASPAAASVSAPAAIVPQSLIAPAYTSPKIRTYPYTQLSPLTYTYYSPYYAYLK